MQSPADTTEAAYERGLVEGKGPRVGVLVGALGEPYAPTNMRALEVREAVRDWRTAASDHGHASYYGASHIRLMRAYWLGRLRAMR